MDHRSTLASGARAFGSVVCWLLAGVTATVIVRDIIELGAVDLLRTWFHLAPPEPRPRVSSVLDGQFLILYLAGAIALRRSSLAAPYFATIAAVTLVFRSVALVTLFTTHSFSTIWRFTEGKWAVMGAAVSLGLALTLLFAVLAGRRPARQHEPLPPPPRPVNAGFAFFFLAVAALARAAWEIRRLNLAGWHDYVSGFTGRLGREELADPPFLVSTWTLCLLLMIAAAAALTKAPVSRPVGLASAWLLLITGLGDLLILVHFDAFFVFDGASLEAILNQLTPLYYLAASALVLLLLAPRGDTSPPITPWQQGAGGYGGGYPAQPHHGSW